MRSIVAASPRNSIRTALDIDFTTLRGIVA
jgi:hypothetical protein